MKYRLVCVDLDGTLLTSDKKLSKVTKNAIKKANDHGIVVAISTGRTYVDAKFYGDLAGVNAPIISSNGAYVRDKDMGPILYQNTFSISLLNVILNICTKYNITPCLNTPFAKYYGGDYGKLLAQIDELSKNINRNVTVYKRVLINSNDEWKNIITAEGDNVVKCEIYTDKEVIVKIREELERLGEMDIIYSTYDSIEITSKGTNKGKGLKTLAKHMNIPLEETIAIGDSENDLSMIKVAGLGVAMSNAENFLKEAADYITLSNDEDGVANVLKRFT